MDKILHKTLSWVGIIVKLIVDNFLSFNNVQSYINLFINQFLNVR